MDTKRLYRSRTNRIICGVCGGVGEYFGVDPTIIRLVCMHGQRDRGIFYSSGDHAGSARVDYRG